MSYDSFDGDEIRLVIRGPEAIADFLVQHAGGTSEYLPTPDSDDTLVIAQRELREAKKRTRELEAENQARKEEVQDYEGEIEALDKTIGGLRDTIRHLRSDLVKLRKAQTDTTEDDISKNAEKISPLAAGGVVTVAPKYTPKYSIKSAASVLDVDPVNYLGTGMWSLPDTTVTVEFNDVDRKVMDIIKGKSSPNKEEEAS